MDQSSSISGAPGALVVALSVLMSAVVAYAVSSFAGKDSEQAASTLTNEELITRIERLEELFEVAPKESATASDSADEVTDGANDARSHEERLARLEELEDARQAERRRLAERERLAREQYRRQMEETARAAARIMADGSADEMQKVRAWQQIRMNAADFWTDDIVAEAVRIGTTSTDPQVRADIWRQAHANHTHPALLQPLLQALATDPDRSVREEAAETLDLYLDQSGVPEALQTAAQYDADEGVRAQAEISLQGPQGGF